MLPNMYVNDYYYWQTNDALKIKWKEASGISWGNKIPMRFKSKFYKIVVRPTIYCMIQSVLVGRQRMSVGELRMFKKWQDSVSVVSIVDQMRKHTLRFIILWHFLKEES